MQLVNLGVGISINPDKVELVRASRIFGYYVAEVIIDKEVAVRQVFASEEEAQQHANEWMAKINETDLGTRVPIEDLDAKSTEIGQAIFDYLVSWGPIKRAVWSLFDRPETTFPVFLSRVVRKHLGGEACNS